MTARTAVANGALLLAAASPVLAIAWGLADRLTGALLWIAVGLLACLIAAAVTR